MAAQITFHQIATNIKNRKYQPDIPAPDLQSHPIYPNGHVFDASKPANWNRKQWENAKAKREKAAMDHMTCQVQTERQFQDDCVKALELEYHIQEPQARIVMQHAWNAYHMMNLTTVLNAIKDMGELTAKIIKSIETER